MDILNTIRYFASQNKITYTNHAIDQLFNRSISMTTIKNVLSDEDNQLIEIQNKSNAYGKEHLNDRYLIYSPNDENDVIVVSVIITDPRTTIRVITAEYVDDNIWRRVIDGNPALIRR